MFKIGELRCRLIKSSSFQFIFTKGYGFNFLFQLFHVQISYRITDFRTGILSTRKGV